MIVENQVGQPARLVKSTDERRASLIVHPTLSSSPLPSSPLAMVLVQYAIPSAHSSNPAYLGPRSTLESPEPETSEGQYSIRQPGVGAPKDWSDLPDDDGLDYGLEGDNVWEDDRARTVSFLMSTRGFTREQALAMCDQNDRENGIVHDDGTPRQATAVQMPDELMLSEGEDSEDDGEVDDEEEEVEEVSPSAREGGTRW